MMRCSVQNCNSDTNKTTKGHGITFHMFPKEPNLRKEWTNALGRLDWEPKDRSTICSEHFRDDDIYVTKCGLRKIKNGAVPVIENDPADLEAPATLTVCRICLVRNTKMYDIWDSNLDRAYEHITRVDVSQDDKLPRKVCWECAARLRACARLRDRALRSHALLTDVLTTAYCITVRDIKSISRSHNNLTSPLVNKYYEADDYDIHINEDGTIVKPESHELAHNEELKEETNQDTCQEFPEIMQVEVKDEQTSNDLYFVEFGDDFNESDDNRALSEVCVKPPAKKQLKKKVKKMKKVKCVKAVKRKESDGDDATATMDKYKTSDVKRRRTQQEALDESLFTITALTYDEQIAEIEKRKESAKYIGAPFKCTVCYRGFLSRDRYDAHAVRHSEQSGAFECFICKTRLKNARALRKHLTSQHTEQFRCKGCPFVTKTRGVAREHEKWHSGTKYQCPHCPSEFDKVTTYLGHIRIKHVSDFVCELCGFTFVSAKGIEVHKKKKHRLHDKAETVAEGPHCAVCDVRFVSEEAHARHLRLSSRHSCEGDPNRIRNDSQSAGRLVREPYSRRAPLAREPGGGAGGGGGAARERTQPAQAGPVTCEQCGIQLRDLRLYAQHFRRAHPDKNRTKYPAMKTPCMCEQCGRIFQSMALLKDHMWVHTGEKRFKCDRCDKSFTQKTNLVFHMRVHSATRPSYECPLCGKHFAFFNNRRRHMFIHTGLKPFKCDTCGKCFTTSGEQRAHVEHVHMKKPWPKRARAPRRDHADHWPKCHLDPMED